MAKNKVRVDVEVTDKGSLKQVSKNAKEAASGLDKTAKAAGTADRNLKGAAQASSNSTKNFSKMAQGIEGGLVPAYATLAANVFAVSAAFTTLSQVAAVTQLEQGLIALGNSAGQNLPAVAQNLKNITGAAVSTEDALRSTATAFSAGFSVTQLESLTKVAKGASLALGRDMTDALDRLVRGTAKLEPEILDELGILVRLDQAASEYAKSLNKSSKDLTQFEKQQAFLNATIEQGTKKFGMIADTVDPNAYNQLSASFRDLTKNTLQLVNEGLNPLIKFLATSDTALLGVLTLFSTTIIDSIIPAMDDAVARSTANAVAASKAARLKIAKETQKIVKASPNLADPGFAPKDYKKYRQSLIDGTASIKDQQKAVLSLKRSEDMRAKRLASYSGEQLKQKKLEIQQIRKLKDEVMMLTSAELRRASAVSKAENAVRRSRMSKRQAGYLQAMEGAGPLQGFIIASRGAKKYTQDVMRAQGVTNTFNAALGGAKRTLGLFGRAFLNAIPIIGQAMLVFSLLEPVFNNLFGKSKVEQNVEKVTESFSSFNNIARQLEKTLTSLENPLDRYNAKLKVTKGIVDQVSASVSSYLKEQSQDEDTKEKIKNTLDDLIEAENDLVKVSHRRAAGEAVSNSAVEVMVLRKIRLEREYNTLLSNQDKLSRDAALGILTKAIATIKQNDVLSEAAKKELAALETKKKQIQKIAENELVDGTGLIQYIEDFNKENSKLLSGYEASAGAANSFFTELNKLSNVSITKFDTLLETAKNFKVELDAVAASAKASALEGPLETGNFLDSALTSEQQIEALKRAKPEVAKFIEFVRKKVGGGILLDEQLVVERYTDQLSTAIDTLATAKSTLKGLQTDQKSLNRLVSLTPMFTQDLLDKNEEVRKQKIKAIEAELTTNTLGLEGNALTLKQKELNAEIAALKKEELSTEEAKYKLEQAKNAQSQFELGLLNKIANSKRTIADLDEKAAMASIDRGLAAERRTNPFAFLDEDKRRLDLELSLQKDLLVSKIEAENERLRLVKEGINIEFALLKAKLTFAKAEADARANDPKLSEEQRNRAKDISKNLANVTEMVSRAESSALQAADKQSALVIQGFLDKIMKLEDAKESMSDLGVISSTVSKSLASEMGSAFSSVIQGTMSVKNAFLNMAQNILKNLADVIAEMLVMQAIKGSMGLFNLASPTVGISDGSSGGDLLNNIVGSYKSGGGFPELAVGGIVKGSQAGYPAILHGTEAVVPLPNGKEIPVQMKNGGGVNNVTVNVSVDNSGNATTQTEAQSSQDAGKLGQMISQAVQKELQNQKRSGGILNPYGAS